MEAIKIVICDDEMSAHKTARNLLQRHADEHGYAYDIHDCFSGKELLESHQGSYILLLDIDMPDMDGISVGQALSRQEQKPHIIMLSGKRERFKEAFQIGAARFVTKPVDKRELFEALDHAVFLVGVRQKIEVKYHGNPCLLLQEEIQVIESKRDYLKIHTQDKVYERNLTLVTLYEELDQELFFPVHKSYIVNAFHVQEILPNAFLMDNGMEIPLARRRKKEIIRKMIDFDRERW